MELLKESKYASMGYLAKKIKEKNKSFNPILVWSGYQTTHYELSKIAIAILSICPSEASVERS